MTGLPGYDAWKCYDAEGERAGALEHAIGSDPRLSRLEHRADLAAARADKLTALLVATPQSDRRDRIARLLRMAAREAKYRANDVLAAYEDMGEER